MRPVPNDIVSTLIRYLPQILENVQIDTEIRGSSMP